MADTTADDVAKSVTKISGRVDALEKSVRALEVSIDDRMGRMEKQLDDSNTHLDSIQREASKTNSLLEGLLGQWTRQEDRLDRRETANREMVVSSASAVWQTVKQPLGYCFAVVATWFALHASTPAPQSLPPVSLPPRAAVIPGQTEDQP